MKWNEIKNIRGIKKTNVILDTFQLLTQNYEMYIGISIQRIKYICI